MIDLSFPSKIVFCTALSAEAAQTAFAGTGRGLFQGPPAKTRPPLSQGKEGGGVKSKKRQTPAANEVNLTA